MNVFERVLAYTLIVFNRPKSLNRYRSKFAQNLLFCKFGETFECIRLNYSIAWTAHSLLVRLLTIIYKLNACRSLNSHTFFTKVRKRTLTKTQKKSKFIHSNHWITFFVLEANFDLKIFFNAHGSSLFIQTNLSCFFPCCMDNLYMLFLRAWWEYICIFTFVFFFGIKYQNTITRSVTCYKENKFYFIWFTIKAFWWSLLQKDYVKKTFSTNLAFVLMQMRF